MVLVNKITRTLCGTAQQLFLRYDCLSYLQYYKQTACQNY